jgi:hypothetical protein
MAFKVMLGGWLDSNTNEWKLGGRTATDLYRDRATCSCRHSSCKEILDKIVCGVDGSKTLLIMYAWHGHGRTHGGIMSMDLSMTGQLQSALPTSSSVVLMLKLLTVETVRIP